MSAVKRVFTHSAIRSAIRQPFVPNDDGYREYLKRSVFELNGTQWGELSEPVVGMSSPWVVSGYFLSSGSSNQKLVSFVTSDSTERLFLEISAGKFRLGSSGYLLAQGPTNVQDGRLHSFRVVFDGVDGFAVYIDDRIEFTDTHSDVSKLRDSYSIYLFCRVAEAAGAKSDFFAGACFGIKMWVGGDEYSGVPTPGLGNIQFDESGSDYQRNRAVALGASLLPANSIADGSGWVSTSVEFDNALIFENEDNFAGANYDIGYSYSTIYEIEFEIFDYVSGNLQATLEGVGSENKAGNGVYKVYLKSPDAGLTRFFLRARNGVGEGTFKVRNISIRAWSGVILQNALPEHWMQIEKKRYWDYWLNPQWPNLVKYSEDLTGSSWSKIRCSVTNSGGINELTTTGDDAYIYTDCLPVDGVSAYTTSWRIRGVAGTVISLYLMRDGFLEPRQSSGLVLNGEWQDFEFTYTFTEEPTTTVRCRFDPAQAGTGGSIGDLYEISRAALYPDADQDYKTTNGTAGQKLEIAQ